MGFTDCHDFRDGISILNVVLMTLTPVCMVPLSLYFALDDTVIHVFWHIFYWGTMFVACLGLMFIPMALNDRKAVEPPHAVTKAMLFQSAVAYLLLCLGWWFLGEYSNAYLMVWATPVDSTNIQGEYEEGKASVYIFNKGTGGGYVQTAATTAYPKVPVHGQHNFNVECHGYLVQQTCQSTDSNGQTTYSDCSYMVYPDECPAYASVVVAPLWVEQRHSNGDPEKVTPMALLFQAHTYVFDKGQKEKRDEHAKSMATITKFEVEKCQTDRLCAMDLRNPATKMYYTEWHTDPSGVLDANPQDGSSAPKLNKPIGPDPTNVVGTVKAQAQVLFKNLGLEWIESIPILYMPADAKDKFEAFEKTIEDSHWYGKAAFVCLGVAYVPLLLLVVADAFIPKAHHDEEHDHYEHDDDHDELIEHGGTQGGFAALAAVHARGRG